MWRKRVYWNSGERDSRYSDPRSQSTRVASTNENPWSLVRPDLVPAWEREFHIPCKVVEIFNSLVDVVHLKALDGQVRVGIGETVESVFEDNGDTTFLLGDLTIDSLVGEESPVT